MPGGNMSHDPQIIEPPSSFVNIVPFPVLKAFQENGGQSDQFVVAQSSDLSTTGDFGEQWLLIDQQMLQVILRDGQRAATQYTILLDEIEDAQIEPAVGLALKRNRPGSSQDYPVLHQRAYQALRLVAHYPPAPWNPQSAVPDFEEKDSAAFRAGNACWTLR
jgi:hypothetical protein